MPKIGITTAESANPKLVISHMLPAVYPKKGGMIKFPAPKKRENKANEVIAVSLVNLICCVSFGAKDKIK